MIPALSNCRKGAAGNLGVTEIRMDHAVGRVVAGAVVVDVAYVQPVRELKEGGDEAADPDASCLDALPPVEAGPGVEELAVGGVDESMPAPLQQRRHHVGVVVQVDEDDVFFGWRGAQPFGDEIT